MTQDEKIILNSDILNFQYQTTSSVIIREVNDIKFYTQS